MAEHRDDEGQAQTNPLVEAWERRTPTQKRLVMFGALALVLVVLLVAVQRGNEVDFDTTAQQTEDDSTMFGPSRSGEATMEQLAAEQRALDQRLTRLSKDVENAVESMRETTKTLRDELKQPQLERQARELDSTMSRMESEVKRLENRLEQAREQSKMPDRPPPATREDDDEIVSEPFDRAQDRPTEGERQPGQTQQPRPDFQPEGVAGRTEPEPDPPRELVVYGDNQSSGDEQGPANRRGAGDRRQSQADAGERGGRRGGRGPEKGDAGTFLPAGSTFQGVLINGVDMPTSQFARNNPHPVLVRVKTNAILPNRFEVDLKECMVLASGFGELASERAYLRANTFSCVKEDGGVIEIPLNAYAVGDKGKAGVQGPIVHRAGQVLANAMKSGLLSGLGDTFGSGRFGGRGGLGFRTEIRPGEDGNVRLPTYDTEQILQQGAGRGLSNAFSRLADYYIQHLEQIYPVIEIQSGRKIDFVVTQGVEIALGP